MPRPPGDADESPHRSSNFRKFKTVNTQRSRTALKPDEYAWLENLMPIGDAKLPAIPAVSAVLATIGESTATTTTTTGGPGSPLFSRYVGMAHVTITGVSIRVSEWAVFNDGGRIQNPGYTGVLFDFGTFAGTQNTVLTDVNGWVSTILFPQDKYNYAAFDFTSSTTVLAWSFASVPDGGDAGPLHCPSTVRVVKSTDLFNWVFVTEMTGMAPGSGAQWGPTWTITTLPMPGARRYWRLSNWVNNINEISHGVSISEAHLYEGTTQKTSQAVVTTNFTFSAGTVANLIDNDFTTIAQISVGQLDGGWIMYDFGTATVIDGIRIASSGGDPDFMPGSVTLDYSDDSTAWIFAGRIEVLLLAGPSTWGNVATLFN